MENICKKNVVGYDYLPEAVVVGGGTFPTHPIPLRIHDMVARIVCCDGAANDYIKGGRVPWRIVGDCDSIDNVVLTDYGEIVRRNSCQETNDQTKAVDYLLWHDIKHIAIIAATGCREDHTIGNIFLLQEYCRRGIDVRMYTDCGMFVPCKGDTIFLCPEGTAISVFASDTKGLRSEGLMYPIYDFDAPWQGTLNRAIASTFTVFSSDYYIVYVAYPQF